MSTPEEVAAYLIETLETFAPRTLEPIDPDRTAWRARHPTLPRTLIELWDYCGGESSPGLFALAHTVLPAFPNKRSSTMKWLSQMLLAKPGTLLWNEQMSPEPRFLTRPGWAEIASDPFCDSLYVDLEGVCWLRSKMVDENNKRIHMSFDRWMAETVQALRDGRIRIDDDRIVCGALAFDRSPLGEHQWVLAKRAPTMPG